ncbi:class I SAM-dependent methyltransferase [Microbacterium sp. P02]|uniref:class I SAM-dependent methyltransferase n=1 Tax=Microbacterium sp. P02 TaxID=3366260 RepID=UPI0036726EE6
MATRDEMSRSFGAAAGVYESGRPDYPTEAVQWLLEPMREPGRALRVADVGAGTGKLTRVIAGLGDDVVAIDPDSEMLAALHAAVPGVPTFVGTAERMPLPDASLDAVVLGQAWHWVDAIRGSLEVGRVLRSGGMLGLIWNVRDERLPWVRRMSEIMHGSSAEQMLADGHPPVAPPFSTLDEQVWGWTRPMSRGALQDMARSRSYVITAAPEEKERIETELDLLFDEIGVVGGSTIELPYVTKAYRGQRP